MRNLLNCILGAACVLLLVNAEPIKAQESSPAQPQVVRAVAAIYPHIAAVAGASGTTSVDIEINASGAVKSVRIVAGPRILGKVAEKSARQWVFAPTKEAGGIRVARLIYVFRLMPANTAPEDIVAVFNPPFSSRD
jgi:TonB family protein